MVKVLSKGGQDLRAIRRHIDYLRFRDDGELAIETDQGEQVGGEGAASALLEVRPKNAELWQWRDPGPATKRNKYVLSSVCISTLAKPSATRGN